MQTDTVILTHQQIAHKLKRMAYQVYESNVTEKEVVIAGIMKNGYLLAKRLKKEIEAISPIQVTLCEVYVDKKTPTNPVTSSMELAA
jgi:pyrimidine operon attenuation protein/uracil phosphoribosyltransferase